MAGEIPKDVYPCPFCGDFYGHSNACPVVLPRLYRTLKEEREYRELKERYGFRDASGKKDIGN